MYVGENIVSVGQAGRCSSGSLLRFRRRSHSRQQSTDEMENPEVDVTRQAELLVMDYLKNTNCPRALDAFMQKSSATRASALASEHFMIDMEAKKNATEDYKSLLHFMLSAAGDKGDATSSTRQRSSSRTSPTKDAEAEIAVQWTKEEVSALKKAIKKTSAVEDKNQRWKEIAKLVGNGKTKKHCYIKYKELKQEQEAKAATKKSSTRRPRSGDEKFKQEPDQPKLKPEKNKVVEVSNCVPAKESVSTSPGSAFVVSNRTAPPQAKVRQASLEILEVEDCEDFGALLDHPASKAPISRTNLGSSTFSSTTKLPTALEIAALQQLLFGSTKKTFNNHWEEQGFVFSTVRDLQYGLVQHQGGPCGILAVVQAYVLRFLLQNPPVDWKNPGVPHQERALVQALTHILWQAARGSPTSSNNPTECIVAIKDSNSAGQRRFMSGYKLHVTTSEEQTRQVFTANLPQFMESTGSGLIQFVVSVLMTKGVDTIKSEMDQLALDSGGQLVGAHDYCTQEIVNLLLCGYACSNVFNGEQVLEGSSSDDVGAVVLRGISSQSVVGFLSLFEAYQNLVVGSFLKQPRFNIWVVCSESHYSVLFVADPHALEDQSLLDRANVDLQYFDGLANQDEEIRLSVDTLAMSEQTPTANHDDLIPPLNLVIRTKWPRASLDWNGVEPLL